MAVLAPNELLKGRTALITGGTSGIGMAIAKSFLQGGANVIVTGRTEDRLKEARTKLRELNCKGHVFSLRMDNREVTSFPTLFDNILGEVREKGIEQIDILVNNAGVLGAIIPNATEEEYDAVLDTNLKGVFFLSQLFGKYMKDNNIQGNILNVASSSALRPAISAYTITKWGVRALTLGLAKALAPYNIVVNGIAPGHTATPMTRRDSTGDIFNRSIPAGRLAIPDEIANMAVVLVSDMGRMIVGDTIFMTGGSGLITFEDINYNTFE